MSPRRAYTLYYGRPLPTPPNSRRDGRLAELAKAFLNARDLLLRRATCVVLVLATSSRSMMSEAPQSDRVMLLGNARAWHLERAAELERDGEPFRADRHRRIARDLDRRIDEIEIEGDRANQSQGTSGQ